MDLQPAQQLPDLLAMADIHLLPQRAHAADLVMPSKLTGLVVPPEDPVALAQAVSAWTGRRCCGGIARCLGR